MAISDQSMEIFPPEYTPETCDDAVEFAGTVLPTDETWLTFDDGSLSLFNDGSQVIAE